MFFNKVDKLIKTLNAEFILYLTRWIRTLAGAVFDTD